VLYRIFDTFAEMGQDNVQSIDILMGAISFLVVAVGGILIGIIFGLIATITTRYTEKIPILEPLIIINVCYLSYLTAELTSTSSILAYFVYFSF
jgi:NhaP-type Na+/H+ or K+/H+ antiporter